MLKKPLFIGVSKPVLLTHPPPYCDNVPLHIDRRQYGAIWLNTREGADSRSQIDSVEGRDSPLFVIPAVSPGIFFLENPLPPNRRQLWPPKHASKRLSRNCRL